MLAGRKVTNEALRPSNPGRMQLAVARLFCLMRNVKPSGHASGNAMFSPQATGSCDAKSLARAQKKKHRPALSRRTGANGGRGKLSVEKIWGRGQLLVGAFSEAVRGLG